MGFSVFTSWGGGSPMGAPSREMGGRSLVEASFCFRLRFWRETPAVDVPS